jgi:hypothetical protein
MVQRHAEFPSCGESLHAAVVIMRGGERSWISAAVSLSMTCIGPPHLAGGSGTTTTATTDTVVPES